MVMALLMIILVTPVQTKAATENSLRSKLQQHTSETIRNFTYADMNGDGKKEAVAITSKTEGDFG